MVDLDKIIKLYTKLYDRWNAHPLLTSIRQGLTYMIPLLLIGSVALIFLSLPIPSYQTMMAQIFGDQWKNIFLYIQNSTFGIMSLIMLLSISYSYVTEVNDSRENKVSPLIAALVSLCSFIAISGMGKEDFSIASFGVIGVFISILVAITATLLFLKLNTLKFLRIRVFTEGASTAFNYAMTSIAPAAITITLFAAINLVMTELMGISDLQGFLSSLFSGLFARIGSPFWGSLLFVFLVHLLWFFGMHGSNILEPVARSIYVPGLAANQAAVALGQMPDHLFTKTFFDTFVLMGGCGTSLCLIAAMLISGKYKNQRRLARLALLPAAFNINEMIVFGIPIVLNPIYFIPFVGVPLLLTLTSYLAMHYSIVPYTINSTEWTTPILIGGYTSTQSISGSILQLFNFILGIGCYIPFVKLAERISETQMNNNLGKITTLFRQGEEQGSPAPLLARQDELGNLARFLTEDLQNDMENGKITLFYQPQMDFTDNIVGVEALLRWKHDSFGYIYPPLIIGLAEESQFMKELGLKIMDWACADLKKLNDLGCPSLTMSINISASQLEDEDFTQNLWDIMENYDISPHQLKIEITEQLALKSTQKIIRQLGIIKEMGVKLAMDDFGMGHTSLLYLKEFDFDTIKLDGSLVREVISNNNCRDIISSIVQLGKSLNYSVIAEYVEELPQRDMLHNLGCHQYQGYLFSRALPFAELVAFIEGRKEPANLQAAFASRS